MSATVFWRSRKGRRLLIQILFLTALIGVVSVGILTARANLARQGINTGFDFLWKTTGWELNFALMPATANDPYWWYLVVGLVNTVFLGLIGLFCATILGLLVGMARSSSNKSAALLGSIYVEIFRNIPLIVQLFFWYAISTRLPTPRNALQIGDMLVSARGIYIPGLNISAASAAVVVGIAVVAAVLLLWFICARRFSRLPSGHRRSVMLIILAIAGLAIATTILIGRLPDTALISHPELAGLNIRGGIRIQPEVYALAFTITTYGAAYIGEIVRGGFKSVGRGQVEAASALGLTNWQVFSRVRLPLAVRAMLPILINQYVWLIKATTLGIAVGFSDFFMVVASSITHTGQTLELIGILMIGFLAINLTLSSILNRINRAIALKGNQTGVAQ